MAEETGTIKTWLAPRSFGFIESDHGGANLFFHLTAFQDSAEPRAGDRVAYEIFNDARTGKMKAINVRLA
jgi:cold shock CspA family protein